jgi:uncharacterized protein YtpQ (UPF0354 family)
LKRKSDSYPLMKILITILFITGIHFNLFSQKIDYSFPAGFKNTISAVDYKVIVDLSVSILEKRYKIDSVKGGSVFLSEKQDFKIFNLDNLVVKCENEKDHSQWNAIVQSHFNSIINSVDEQKKLNPSDYNNIKSRLCVRIYPDATIDQRGGLSNLISKEDLKGTKTLLMLDLPQAFTPVSKKEFELWNKPTDEVFKVAIENAGKQKMEKVTKTFDVDGVEVEFNFLENEDYAASYALGLSVNSPDLVGEWGAVVVIPNKGLVSVCKITKSKPVDFVKFIQRIKPLIEKSYSNNQNPVSPDFFWYYNGKFTDIDVITDEKGNINVVAPQGLSTLMTTKD